MTEREIAEVLQSIVDDATYEDNYRVECGERLARAVVEQWVEPLQRTSLTLLDRLADRDARLARVEEALTFDRLREANLRRCEEVFHPLAAWSLTDWATAAAGELGEACNVIKKMRRHEGSHNDPARHIDPTSEEGRRALAYEIADTVIYLDLLAARAGISLGDAVREKFNLVSQKNGSVIMLADAGVGKERGDEMA